jgi:hypothetical protein
MNADDRFIIERTMLSAEILCCPICEHVISVPPVLVSDALGSVFGMSGDTLARVHAEQTATRAARDMRQHLADHKPDEWLQRINPWIGVAR